MGCELLICSIDLAITCSSLLAVDNKILRWLGRVLLGVFMATLAASVLNNWHLIPYGHNGLESWCYRFAGALPYGLFAPVFFVNTAAYMGGGQDIFIPVLKSFFLTNVFYLAYYSSHILRWGDYVDARLSTAVKKIWKRGE